MSNSSMADSIGSGKSKVKKRIESRRLFFSRVANALLALYAASIYIWSDNEDMVLYSALLCLASMVCMLYVVVTRRDFYIPKAFFFLIAFNVLCVLSMLWAVRLDKAMAMAVRTLPLLTLFALVLYNYIDEIKDPRVLIGSIYIAGIVLALYTIYMQGGLGGYLNQLGLGERVGENVNNVNAIGLGTGISAIIAFYYVISKRRLAHLLALFLCGFVALGTGSNKALVVMALGCFLILLFDAISSGSVLSLVKLIIGITVIVAAFMLLLQLPMFETINQRFTGMINAYMGNGRIDGSARIRNVLVKAGLAQFVQAPVFGIGINNGSVVAMKAVGHDYYLHNNYVELLVDVGVVGTALFYALPLVALVVCLKKVKQGDAEAVLVVAIMLAWLIIQWGYVSYYGKPTYLYFALFAVVALPAPPRVATNSFARPVIRRRCKQ